jgi:hypothetical protein
MHVSNQEPIRSCSLHGVGGKDRVSFGTDMSTEESGESVSAQEKDALKMTVVERFQEWKFGQKSSLRGDKRALLKVHKAGGSKKQKTPVKEGLKVAIRSLMKVESEGLEEVKMDVELRDNPALQKLEPQHLMGSQDETRQEKWVYWAGTAEDWGSPRQFKGLYA